MASNMTDDQATNLLYENIHVPLFFNKLATAHGIAPATEAEATSMLTLASQLRFLHESQQKEAASATGRLVNKGLAQVDALLGKQASAAGAVDAELRQVADACINVPEYLEAALRYGAVLATA